MILSLCVVLQLCIICAFSIHWSLCLLLSKGWYKSSVCEWSQCVLCTWRRIRHWWVHRCVSHLSVFCVREVESGTDESGQVWTLKNGKTVLYPALTGIWTHGSNIAISILDQLCWIGWTSYFSFEKIEQQLTNCFTFTSSRSTVICIYVNDCFHVCVCACAHTCMFARGRKCVFVSCK